MSADPVNVVLSKKERFERVPDSRSADFHERLFELEDAGEWVVQRVPDDYVPVTTAVRCPP